MSICDTSTILVTHHCTLSAMCPHGNSTFWIGYEHSLQSTAHALLQGCPRVHRRWHAWSHLTLRCCSSSEWHFRKGWRYYYSKIVDCALTLKGQICPHGSRKSHAFRQPPIKGNELERTWETVGGGPTIRWLAGQIARSRYMSHFFRMSVANYR